MIRSTRRRRTLQALAAACLVGTGPHGLAEGDTRVAQGAPPSRERAGLWMTIGGTRRFAMTLGDKPAALAFAQLLPLTLDMPDLNANEKHARLPRSLPAQPMRPGTISTGDVML